MTSDSELKTTFLTTSRCTGDGVCLSIFERNFTRDENCKFKCEPTTCPNCFKLTAQYEMGNGHCIRCNINCPNCSKVTAQCYMRNGHCIGCDMLWYAKDMKAYNNQKTRLLCDHCLKPLDRKYHREDYKNSKYAWVQGQLKLPCMNCPCKLFKCRYCKDVLWEDEDENENDKGACYGCSVGDPFSEPRIEEDEYYQ